MANQETAALRFDRQTLIFDADDTLWENNVYFERAIDDFLDFLAHSTLSRQDARVALDQIERANQQVHGYGSAAFTRNLRQCYEQLAEREIGDEDLATVIAFGERILSQPMEIIAGVEPTLAELAPRHDLILMTKGHAEEQRLKIDRSGLGCHFRHAAVVREKHVAAYQTLVAELDLDPDGTWMIGNSPRSDVNPALAAGLHAVYLPHLQTWRLEDEELASGRGRLLVLDRFRDLLDHF